jgi:hypothetical protein
MTGNFAPNGLKVSTASWSIPTLRNSSFGRGRAWVREFSTSTREREGELDWLP